MSRKHVGFLAILSSAIRSFAHFPPSVIGLPLFCKFDCGSSGKLNFANLNTPQWGGAKGSVGARTRSFTYDSLSRLTQAYNPESGWLCYGTTGGAPATGSNCTTDGYDANDNLAYKTDGRGVTIDYTYDVLNRILGRTYSNDTSGTLSSCYRYDLSASVNGVGRLANEWTQTASAGPCAAMLPASGFWSKRSVINYDPMGRILSEQQYAPFSSTTGTAFSPAYTYDLAGHSVTSTSGVSPTPTSAPITYDQRI